MLSINSPLRFFLLATLSCILAGTAFSQPSLIALENELGDLRDKLVSLETAEGVFSQDLVETLEEIADRLTMLGEYRQSYELLDRAQHIVRINEGLFSSSQYRFLHKKIENLVNDGDWQSGRKLQDNLFWLYTRKPSNVNDNTVADLLRASDMHLRGVVEDSVEYRRYHYRNAASHTFTALIIARKIWHPEDLRLGQLMYEQIKQNYLQALAVQERQGTAMAVQLDGFSETVIIDPQVAASIHRGNGYLNLERLRQHYLDLEVPDLEAAAMATLYRADWQILFQQEGLAVVSYAEAHAELLAAGVEKQHVEELFSEPTLIPVPDFHTSVSAALASRQNQSQYSFPPVYDGPLSLSFDQSVEDSSTTDQSVAKLASENTQAGMTQLPFTLTGFTIPANMRENTKLDWLRFRPKLVNAKPVGTSGIASIMP